MRDSEHCYQTIMTLYVIITETLKSFQLNISNGLVPPLVKPMFYRTNDTLQRNFPKLTKQRKRAVDYGFETLSYQAPQLWSVFLENVKQTASLSKF